MSVLAIRWVGVAFLLGSASLSSGCAPGYYEPCSEDGRCAGGLFCAEPGSIDVCTTLCVETAECVEDHGEGSFCSLGGACLTRCDLDDDCPLTSYCDTRERVCVR